MKHDISPIGIQLLLKSLNTPVDLLSELCQSISLILRLYACSSSTNLIACKCAKTLEDAGQNFNNERITNKKRLYGLTLSKHETAFHTCIQTFEQ